MRLEHDITLLVTSVITLYHIAFCRVQNNKPHLKTDLCLLLGKLIMQQLMRYEPSTLHVIKILSDYRISYSSIDYNWT